MKVIPVIDVLNGIVVHAVKGQRKEYKPLRSRLTNSTSPLEVAIAFKNLGFTQLYMADLGAIISCSTNFEAFRQIFDQTTLKLWVDAGLTEVDRAKRLLESGVSKIIVGTETLQNLDLIREAVEFFGRERVVVSLDLMDNKVLIKKGFDGDLRPLDFLNDIERLGVGQVIILDLKRVGSGEGVDFDFIKRVVEEIDVNVFVGGGIRNINDLFELKKLDISGALVATALHNERISVDELKKNEFL